VYGYIKENKLGDIVLRGEHHVRTDREIPRIR